MKYAVELSWWCEKGGREDPDIEKCVYVTSSTAKK